MPRLLLLALLVSCKGADSAPAFAPAATSTTRRAPPHPDAGPHPAGDGAFYAATFERQPTVPEMTGLGELVFHDPGLSASGTLACASCHDPDNAYAPADAQAVELGGRDGTLVGVRAAPSLRYLQSVPRFTEHFSDPDTDDGADQGPAGGLTWDGRAQSLHDQARSPLYSPLEMANASPEDLAARLRRAPYAHQFRTAFGAHALESAASAQKALTLVLEVFQQDPARFYPYTSKFDAVLRGRDKLTEHEARGFALFDDPKKGNCASCHPSAIKDGFPAFTDFGYVALGVPRNRALPANADPSYFDLGLCGPYRTDLAAHPEYCGRFRTPSLRNVARRHRFMHNGVFTSLQQVLEFYATRDGRFDDLPPRYRQNVNVEPPFGGPRRLSAAEIADIIAFLETLSDRP